VQLNYIENPSISPETIASLREAVGWGGRRKQLEKIIDSSYLIVACFHHDNLVGFVDVISDGVDDALIRNLLVHPDYQGEGIGLRILKLTVERLRIDQIKTVNVLFEPGLTDLYRKAGFRIICGGVIDNEVDRSND